MSDPTCSARTFLATTAKQRLTTYDAKTWEYFDVGPRSATTIVLLPDAIGSAIAYHALLPALAAAGYRALAVHCPVVWTHDELVHSLDRFLDALNLASVHLYGASLGATLAQRFCSAFPHRVRSLVLTRGYNSGMAIGTRYLKILMLKELDTSEDVAVNAASDFLRQQLESLSQAQLASRLTLGGLSSSSGPARDLHIPYNRVTLLDSYGSNNAADSDQREVMYERFRDAKKALLKASGRFPYLSHPDDVVLYLQVHLRAHAC
ncbi:hypothetical protein SPRG_22137 [Saprolegnia parasitica CBS 223.65]|uniref:Maspardin n=1 Tax=Saprolegnia parasitica (strain CBS 223.65) TaxID=695850 RepID=A0A067CJE4_SAPPC|nr:hypothetical protein SPRG_22137 [Saprolegnia parasitica CBS 223.65]KDO30854.1 hypothetical protein SPRG_22137 [Saprolegnia parasitica CBS 223.65]|eukprot:XP_012198635.1 hypothetical protein SPRG_22137 [Saprolegnia parasitica CBS 223.65]